MVNVKFFQQRQFMTTSCWSATSHDHSISTSWESLLSTLTWRVRTTASIRVLCTWWNIMSVTWVMTLHSVLKWVEILKFEKIIHHFESCAC